MKKIGVLFAVLASFLVFGFSAGRDGDAVTMNGWPVQKAYIDDDVERASFILPVAPTTLFQNGTWYVYSFENGVPCYVSTQGSNYAPPATREKGLSSLKSQFRPEEQFKAEKASADLPGVRYCIDYSYVNKDGKRFYTRFIATKRRSYYIRIEGEISYDLKTMIYNSFTIVK